MDRCVLIDLDKTLIDSSYQLTSSEIYGVVAECEQRGLLVGLCSDSALPTLRRWSDHLGMRGPIVFERGAGIYFPATGENITLHPEATGWFRSLRTIFVEKALEHLPDWAVFIGDNTEMKRAGIAFPGDYKIAILVSALRDHSFGAHIASHYGERLLTDAASREVLRRIRLDVEVLAANLSVELLDVDENQEYGVLIVHASTNSKRNATRELLSRGLGVVGLIGDSIYDYVNEDRVKQYAVANADQTYKAKCCYVATAPITEGVAEILQMIIGQS